ncbi:MAG: radical SAM/SPASM domain-containing protein [Methanomicrobiales archaeon HGW-Methanomicrobiales-2]|jgi:radical SAM protein with 4Fe4S-binding SPASM domain|nr:MAG: radical SAM/SPASM domain-containing protein [Methanomicrobiales archaeon HGW-Methanomicrobiales-2]
MSQSVGDGRNGSGPALISWNVTSHCNLRCAHCYLDAGDSGRNPELTTSEAKMLIDQVTRVGSPVMILSGGEPLLRGDLFEIAEYGTSRGLRMVLGTNGTLIDDRTAVRLGEAGIRKAAISLDSADPGVHDRFRGVRGAWSRAVTGIEACREAGIGLQIHTTVTLQNYQELDAITALGENLGVHDFQFFFLVPTGRGKDVTDISPERYETLIRGILQLRADRGLAIRPTCAPQYVRIASEMGLPVAKGERGCIAGIRYCRIDPTGEVTPCPYLPLSLGNIRTTSFAEIWNGSEVFTNLRSGEALTGKCGRCEYRSTCGGCRARAYGLTEVVSHACGGAVQRSGGDYLAQDPWCLYEPGKKVR